MNILTLITDQQRADTIGALGNPAIRTPHLDSLVRSGVTFTRAYTPTPVCVAARCALATGLPAAHTRCWDNNTMPGDAVSYMQALQAKGYQTHGIGKMHFTPDYRRSWGYETRDISEEGKPGDFDAFLRKNGFGHVLAPNGLRGEYYYTPQPSQLPAHLHETRWIADRSIDFLKKRDRDRPFLLDCHFIKPHPPFENPMPWSFLYRTDDMDPPYIPENFTDFHTRINTLQNRYKYKDRAYHDDLAWRTMKAAYYGAISFIDQQVGRILEALGDEIDNTLILFSSDHGEMLGDYGCVGKRCLLEASARIPFLMRLPQAAHAGKRIDTPISLTDVFTTLTQATEAPYEDPHGAREGANLIELAAGSTPKRTVYSQFQHDWMGNYMATDGKTKFVYSAADDKRWNFQLDDSLRETLVQSPEPTEMEIAALQRFAAFPQANAVENETWKQHEPHPWPDNPDYGLLRQDPDGLAEMLKTIAPYHDGNLPDAEAGLKPINDHMPEK